VNHAARIHYMSAGQFTVPLIVRTVTGGGAGLGATHSQSLEGWYATVPGMMVVSPSTPYDALGLLRSCFKQNGPVIFCEHALLYGTRGEVPDDYYEIPLGQPRVARQGKDITLVGYSRMAHVATEAADLLAQRGVEAEVIDLRGLRPLDLDPVIASVNKTHRCVVVEETWAMGGFGAWIAHQVETAVFDSLDGPVVHLGGADVPSPYARNLEQLVIPNAASVIKVAEEQFGL